MGGFEKWVLVKENLSYQNAARKLFGTLILIWQIEVGLKLGLICLTDIWLSFYEREMTFVNNELYYTKLGGLFIYWKPYLNPCQRKDFKPLKINFLYNFKLVFILKILKK